MIWRWLNDIQAVCYLGDDGPKVACIMRAGTGRWVWTVEHDREAGGIRPDSVKAQLAAQAAYREHLRQSGQLVLS